VITKRFAGTAVRKTEHFQYFAGGTADGVIAAGGVILATQADV
jgi:hypothetical protein